MTRSLTLSSKPLSHDDQPQGRTALVVDDEPMVAAALGDSLEYLGLTVFVHCNPEQALAAFGSDIDAIDILITDVLMPGMNGVELAESIRRLRPDLPVLFVTGYAAKLTLPGPVVAKPYRLADLQTALDRMGAR